MADEMMTASPIGAILKSTFAAVASLGALNSLAGATTLTSNNPSPENGTVGTAISSTAFGVIGTTSPPGSWTIKSIPPGLSVVDPSGGNPALTGSGGNTNAATPVLTGTPPTAGTFVMTLQAFELASEMGIQSPIYSFTVVVSASANAPSFSVSPQDTTVNVGQSVTFTASASGSPGYQWQFNGNNISGATSATFTIASPQTTDAGAYDVVATNSSGTTTSGSANLTVVSPTAKPIFTVQPLSQTVSQGVSINFNATATGATSYQWQKGGANVNEAQATGATTDTMTLTNVQVGDSASYTVIATNANGSTTSNTATLTVNASALPVITTQPASQSAAVGQTVTFTVIATGGPTYQWSHNGTMIPGATQASLTLSNVQSSDAGSYTVVADNTMTTSSTYGSSTTGGPTTSNAAVLTIAAAGAPAFTTQPQSQTVNSGANVTLTAAASNSPTYQWQFNGNNISGATSASYTLNNVTAGQSGNYAVVATNASGSVTSTVAALTVNSAASGPSFPSQPVSQTVAVGSTVVFSAVVAGSPTPTLQWNLGGTPVSGGNGPVLVVGNASSANAGNYSLTATNSSGTATSSPATLTVSSTTNPGRLINLSILSYIQGSLSMGFVTGGAGTSGLEPLLIRGVGPSIGPGTAFSVPGVMIDPTLAVVQQSNHTSVASNSGWGNPASNASAVQTADAATGAFALTNTSSLDSAVVANLPGVGGGYSATVTGASGDNGWALTEVYDDTAAYSLTSTRLINLSCLTSILTAGTLDVGFVIGGTTAKTVLVRVGGPALSTLYNIGGAMPDPQLQVSPLSNSATVLALNAGWGGNPVIASVAGNVGAYTFPSASSLDSAALVTLSPGAYTVQVNSKSGLGGTVLVEIYEVP